MAQAGPHASTRQTFRPRSNRLRALTSVAALVAVGWASGCQLLAGTSDPLVDPLSAAAPDGGPSRDGTVGGSSSGEAGGGSAYASAVLEDGPVLYLRFSETSGAHAADSSKSGGEHLLSGAFVHARPGLIVGDPDPSVGLGNGAQIEL